MHDEFSLCSLNAKSFYHGLNWNVSDDNNDRRKKNNEDAIFVNLNSYKANINPEIEINVDTQIMNTDGIIYVRVYTAKS